MVFHKGPKDGLGNLGFSAPEIHRSSLSCSVITQFTVLQTLRTTKEWTRDVEQTLIKATLCESSALAHLAMKRHQLYLFEKLIFKELFSAGGQINAILFARSPVYSRHS